MITVMILAAYARSHRALASGNKFVIELQIHVFKALPSKEKSEGCELEFRSQERIFFSLNL